MGKIDFDYDKIIDLNDNFPKLSLRTRLKTQTMP